MNGLGGMVRKRGVNACIRGWRMDARVRGGDENAVIPLLFLCRLRALFRCLVTYVRNAVKRNRYTDCLRELFVKTRVR